VAQFADLRAGLGIERAQQLHYFLDFLDR
jgi:hypothetical protein